jgi:hypothetical protein
MFKQPQVEVRSQSYKSNFVFKKRLNTLKNVDCVLPKIGHGNRIVRKEVMHRQGIQHFPTLNFVYGIGGPCGGGKSPLAPTVGRPCPYMVSYISARVP